MNLLFFSYAFSHTVHAQLLESLDKTLLGKGALANQQQHKQQQFHQNRQRRLHDDIWTSVSIAVCSAHITNASSPAAYSTVSDIQKIFDNHRQYANRHNYTYVVQTVPLVDDSGNEISIYWTKINLIKKLLRPPHTFDWVFWIDSDAVVVNMAQSIESLLYDPVNRIALHPYVDTNNYHSSSSSSSSRRSSSSSFFSSLIEVFFPSLASLSTASSGSTSSGRSSINNIGSSGSSSSSSKSSSRNSSSSSSGNQTSGRNMMNVSRPLLRPVTSLVFSGDTNAINAGVLLFRRTDYSLYIIDEVIKIGAKLDAAGVQIGMGADNAAFSIFLGGCNSSMDYDRYAHCYDRVDIGYLREEKRRNKEVWRKIIAGDHGTYSTMIDPSVLPHIAPVKQKDFQAYSSKQAKFVLHFVGTKRQNKFQDLVNVLKTVK